MTRVAERTITDDLEYLIKHSVDVRRVSEVAGNYWCFLELEERGKKKVGRERKSPKKTKGNSR